jgi:OOP family OmpA-OmpF porin
MNALSRLSILALAALLSACSTTSERQYEACIAGYSAAGGVGGALAGGGGALAGAAVGAAASSVLCAGPPEPEPAPLAAAPVDSDGDGVSDDRDACPGTPAGVEVDPRGCPLDSDGDGVADYRDQCPNTPAGVTVDDSGCPVKDEVILTIDRLGFAFDSAELNAESKAALDAAVAVIQSHSSVSLDVVGYTDSSGPEAYNQRLSERRAQAAVDYLVSQGVDAGQLRAVGRGEANPVASNDTRPGRMKNRRVELVVR